MRSNCDPQLVKQADEMGLYDRETYPVCYDVNPYYLRGDFNGDGGVDVAFWITKRETGVRGVAIIHSTLDTLYIFGAGMPRPNNDREEYTVRSDSWHLLFPGDIENRVYNTIPEIGAIKGEPFTFERETMEFVYFGKSAYVFYWANGRYWEFWTAD